MTFRTALAWAALVHGLVGVIVYRTWPEPPPPAGEVVPLELRAVEPPPPAPAPPPPAPVAPAVASGGAAPKVKSISTSKPSAPVLEAPTVIEEADPTGEIPAAAPAPPAKNAVGNGSGPGAGIGAGSGSGPGVADHHAIFAQALERIRARRHYPELARRRHLEGTVTVAFRVAPDGSVTAARVSRGADETLNGAALEAVRAAAPLPPALAGDGELEVDLDFRLQN